MRHVRGLGETVDCGLSVLVSITSTSHLLIRNHPESAASVMR
jgi:hypothetical protein